MTIFDSYNSLNPNQNPDQLSLLPLRWKLVFIFTQASNLVFWMHSSVNWDLGWLPHPFLAVLLALAIAVLISQSLFFFVVLEQGKAFEPNDRQPWGVDMEKRPEDYWPVRLLRTTLGNFMALLILSGFPGIFLTLSYFARKGNWLLPFSLAGFYFCFKFGQVVQSRFPRDPFANFL